MGFKEMGEERRMIPSLLKPLLHGLAGGNVARGCFPSLITMRYWLSSSLFYQLPDVTVEYMNCSMPQSLKWYIWSLRRVSCYLGRKKTSTMDKPQKLINQGRHFWQPVFYGRLLTAKFLGSCSRFHLFYLYCWLVKYLQQILKRSQYSDCFCKCNAKRLLWRSGLQVFGEQDSIIKNGIINLPRLVVCCFYSQLLFLGKLQMLQSVLEVCGKLAVRCVSVQVCVEWAEMVSATLLTLWKNDACCPRSRSVWTATSLHANPESFNLCQGQTLFSIITFSCWAEFPLPLLSLNCNKALIRLQLKNQIQYWMLQSKTWKAIGRAQGKALRTIRGLEGKINH